MNLIQKIKEAQICLVLLPKSDYNTLALKIVKKLAKENNNFCYITLNKPLKTLLTSLKKNKINTDNFFFIDATGSSKSAKQNFSVPSPSAFAQIGIAFSNALKHHIEQSFFDSASTLLLYGEISSAGRLLHSLINSSRNAGSKMLYFALSEDKDTELLKNIYVFVDEIINYAEDKF